MNGSTLFDLTAHNNKPDAKIISTNNTHEAIAINLDTAILGPAGKAGVLKLLG